VHARARRVGVGEQIRVEVAGRGDEASVGGGGEVVEGYLGTYPKCGGISTL
jgi:hypothetical protein